MIAKENPEFMMHLFLFARRDPAKCGVLTASWAYAHVARETKSGATEAGDRDHRMTLVPHSVTG
jgi:hypothetical protein